MFKLLAPQQLNNPSDDRFEYQILDRLSSKSFLGLQLDDHIPDAKTVWLFRERLRELNLTETLFTGLYGQFAQIRYVAKAEQMIDATFVVAPSNVILRKRTHSTKSKI